MKNDYICPHCRGFLNIDKNICFSVITKSGAVGLINLNPEVGNYSFQKHAAFDLIEGEQIDFFCPICHANLESPKLSSILAKIILFDQQDKTEYEILFSKIVGERCTYKMKGDKVVPFGEQQAKYLNRLQFNGNLNIP